jgi:LCP family protein required for cell wall assembly
MMNTSSKFGISMRQSIIAFVIMIVLIIVASGFSDLSNKAQAGAPSGYESVLAAPSGSDLTPTPTPFQPVPITPTQPAALVTPEPVTVISTEVFAASSTPESTVPPEAPVPSATSRPLTSILNELLSFATGKPSKPEPNYRIAYMPVLSRGDPPTPIPPTPTPIPFTPQDSQLTGDEGRSWQDYPGPTIWPDIAVPAPVGLLSHPEDQINILLLGSDQREGDNGFRTDTILLVTINPSEGTVKLTSFPRDLYVYIPGYTVQRINTAFGWGGFDALADTMEYNFGVRPEYYAMINLWSFIDVINSIEGVTVEIGRDLCDHRDNWGEFCVSQGTMWMDGKTALWYVRSRKTTSDLDRGRRQQEVLEAVFDKIISMDGLHVPELYDIYRDNVLRTSLDMLP